MTWEFREHTADLRVALTTPSFEDLFRDAVRLFRELVAGTAPPSGSLEHHRITLEADAPSELLFGFLRELLFRFDTARVVPVSIDIHRVEPTQLDATLSAEAFDSNRHETQPEIKAVTRHGLQVARRGSTWYAEVVFDL